MKIKETSQDLWLKKMPIAHRGLHSNKPRIPENSIRAFKNAIKHNYAIELDVLVMSGQQVIVFHDDNLKRMCGIDKPVIELDSFNYKYYQLSGTDETIPLLQDVLDVVDGRVPLLIGIKKQHGVKNTNMIILNSLLGYKGPVAIQSFNPFVMGWFSKNAPSLTRGQISSDFKNKKMNFIQRYLLKKLKLNFISKPHFIAYDMGDLPNNLIKRKRRNGMSILAWTVDSTESNKRVNEFCDNIIFENFYP
ncbi:MAG TPA: glycerophosphodiester phosphodiesterase family protein [Mucilaginibacter sp.]|jgi:glycerophosphoryl diester phosphodiesterase|nr:glycerophosphodiester phosphodiesterase family protein [Mucilaginibacter sp.]